MHSSSWKARSLYMEEIVKTLNRLKTTAIYTSVSTLKKVVR